MSTSCKVWICTLLLSLSHCVGRTGSYTALSCTGHTCAVMTTAAMRERSTPTTTAATPDLALTAPTYGSPRCARSPSTVCAIAELALDGKQLIFTAFDPVKGRGRELTKSNLDPIFHYTRNLSPDGTSIALLEGSEERIRILPLTGQQQRHTLLGEHSELTAHVTRGYASRKNSKLVRLT